MERGTNLLLLGVLCRAESLTDFLLELVVVDIHFGLTNIPLWQLVVLAVIGRAPAFFLVNVVGDLLGTDQFPAAVMLAVFLVVVSAVGYRKRDLLIRRFGRDS